MILVRFCDKSKHKIRYLARETCSILGGLELETWVRAQTGRGRKKTKKKTRKKLGLISLSLSSIPPHLLLLFLLLSHLSHPSLSLSLACQPTFALTNLFIF
jgi:hypothetical protein